MYIRILAELDALFTIGSRFILYIQHRSDELAYDFTLYDMDFHLLDGGVSDFDGDIEESGFDAAARKIAEYFGLCGAVEPVEITESIEEKLFGVIAG